MTTGEIDPDLEMILADMRQGFIEDTQDKIGEIEAVIGDIRQRNGAFENNLMEVKRLMHTIKGGGGSFGFPTISKIAHGFEDYLETSGTSDTVVAEDLLVFTDAIAAILDAGHEPDDQHAHMMLRSLPAARRQSGARALDKGTAMLVMPRGVQRKIIGQELAQFGFKVNISEDPVKALDMAMTLKPDFVIVTLMLERMDGIEFAWVLRTVSATAKVRVAIVTAHEISEEVQDSLPPGAVLIRKGKTFSAELMQFIRSLRG